METFGAAYDRYLAPPDDVEHFAECPAALDELKPCRCRQLRKEYAAEMREDQ